MSVLKHSSIQPNTQIQIWILKSYRENETVNNCTCFGHICDGFSNSFCSWKRNWPRSCRYLTAEKSIFSQSFTYFLRYYNLFSHSNRWCCTCCWRWQSCKCRKILGGRPCERYLWPLKSFVVGSILKLKFPWKSKIC